MNLSRENILKSMHRFVSSCCSIPCNLFQVAKVPWSNTFSRMKCFFDFFLYCSDACILLWSIKSWSIVTNYNCNSGLWWKFLSSIILLFRFFCLGRNNFWLSLWWCSWWLISYLCFEFFNWLTGISFHIVMNFISFN